METESPVVSTTSSIDLGNSTKPKHDNQNDGDQQTTEKADSTVQNNDEESLNGTKEENVDVQLIEGLPKPSLELEKVDFHRNSHNRVKLYVLCDQRAWDDRGTGHVTCLQSSEDSNIWCIIVRLESNERNVLESKIQQETVYQKQQGTLIVWSETDTVDLALSFQEKSGCSELWEKICRIQGKDPDTETEEDNENEEQENAPSDGSTSGVSIVNNGAIPPCNLQNLVELEQALSNSMFANSQREKMANAIIQNGYIQKLCDLFPMCEDLENKEALQQMASIGKNLFLLNNNSILNELIDERYFKSIVGMLEYDASYTEPRRHREFLWERSRFREVLPISSNDLKLKIHQTFRLQYVQDVCLPAPSIFEENLLTVLTSHLFFIRAEIVNALLNDRELMQQLFDELRNSDIIPERQRDLTNFLKEFCSFAHSLQPTGPQGREQFFKTLMANDVLSTIDPCISSQLISTRTATVELLTIIVDFNPQIFRDFLIKQFRHIPETKNSSLLINKLINHMLGDKDAEFTAAHQMANILKILLDPESIIAKGEKVEFLQMFYKRAMHTLCAPITENAKDGKPLYDSYYMANKIALIVDLLCFFVEHHNINMRAYTVQKNLLQSVLVYLESKHHFLAHSALRLLRRIIGLKDDVYIRHIYDKGILDAVVHCFVANGTRYNLLNSSLIELFEYIRAEEIRQLISYTIQKHWESTFSKVEYVRTFHNMKVRTQQYADANGDENDATTKDSVITAALSMTPPNAQWKKEREHDDEEIFFKEEDEDEMVGQKTQGFGFGFGVGEYLQIKPAPQLRKSGLEPMFPPATRKRKANDDDDNIASVFGGNITPPAGTAGINRMSKIMFRINNNNGKEQLRHFQTNNQGQQTHQQDTETLNRDSQLFYRKASSPASPNAESTTALGSNPSSKMKRPLVDYDDSDDEDNNDDDDEERREGNNEKADSTTSRKGKTGKVKNHSKSDEPVKIPKLYSSASDSSTRDPSSPPPDPEQQKSGSANNGERGSNHHQHQQHDIPAANSS